MLAPDYHSWQADVPGGLSSSRRKARWRVQVLDPTGDRTELERPAQRFCPLTGQRMGSIFRAPGGKTSPPKRRPAAAGPMWVGTRGLSGDELSSARYPNAALLERALREIRGGDVLVAHLGIWSRQDPWAPAVLEPRIRGLSPRPLFCHPA